MSSRQKMEQNCIWHYILFLFVGVFLLYSSSKFYRGSDYGIFFVSVHNPRNTSNNLIFTKHSRDESPNNNAILLLEGDLPPHPPPAKIT